MMYHKNSLFDRPIIARKFGRQFEVFDLASNSNAVSLHHRKLGKVQVDCQLRLSKSKWGILGEAGYPAGIIYISLGFHQPKYCRLSSAVVSISLEDSPRDESAGKSSQKIRSPELHITDQYGPKQLQGEKRAVSVKKSQHLSPDISILGNGVSGIGVDIEKETVHVSRWTFNGQMIPRDIVVSPRGTHASVYRTLRWELSENDLETSEMHSNVVHTAFTFQHDGNPFYMEVDIQGKLRSAKDEIMRYMKFSSDRDRKRGSTTTLINLGRRSRYELRLDDLANSLPRAMEIANLETVPTEIPYATPALVHTNGNIAPDVQIAGSTRAFASQLRNGSTPSNEMSNKLLDPTYPSIENLSKALQIFASVPQIGPAESKHSQEHLPWPSVTRANAARGSVHSEVSGSSSSASTLVEECSLRSNENENTETHNKVNNILLATKEKDAHEALLRLSRSPVFLLFFRMFLGLLNLFRAVSKADKQDLSSAGGKISKDKEILVET